MFEQLIKRHRVISRLEDASSKKLFENYSSYLILRGYKTNTSQVYLRCIKHFINWFDPKKIKEPQITAKTVDKFINKHLPVCACQSPSPCDLKTVRAALKLLLKMLDINKTSNAISANPSNSIDSIIKKI